MTRVRLWEGTSFDFSSVDGGHSWRKGEARTHRCWFALGRGRDMRVSSLEIETSKEWTVVREREGLLLLGASQASGVLVAL